MKSDFRKYFEKATSLVSSFLHMNRQRKPEQQLTPGEFFNADYNDGRVVNVS